jgi:REP element-mobilizing transposase RayT
MRCGAARATHQEHINPMPSSYTNLLAHLVFGTRKRAAWITSELESRLYEYLGGIIRSHKCTLLEIAGMPDHVHLLVRLHPDVAMSALVRELKSESTSWIKRTNGPKTTCGWQRGYGAFSVSRSVSEEVRKYIRNQKTHHARRNFEEEFVAMLKLHNVEYDESYIWD